MTTQHGSLLYMMNTARWSDNQVSIPINSNMEVLDTFMKMLSHHLNTNISLRGGTEQWLFLDFNPAIDDFDMFEDQIQALRNAILKIDD